MAQGQLKLFCDLDGTLLDVSSRHYHVYRELTLEFNGEPLDKATYWDLKRKKTKWPELLPLSGVAGDRVGKFLEQFIPRIENPENLKLDTVFPGALETLGRLQKRYECYLVSLRRSRGNLLQQLEWLGLPAYFQSILTGHSETDGYDVKISLIRQHQGPGRDLIIGDTEADVIAGQQLGLETFAVYSGIRDKLFLMALKPDHLMRSINDLERLTLTEYKH